MATALGGARCTPTHLALLRLAHVHAANWRASCVPAPTHPRRTTGAPFSGIPCCGSQIRQSGVLVGWVERSETHPACSLYPDFVGGEGWGEGAATNSVVAIVLANRFGLIEGKSFHSHCVRASHFFLSGQEEVTKKKATPRARSPGILPSDFAIALRGSLTARPCTDSELARILRAIASRLYLRAPAAPEGPRRQRAPARRSDDCPSSSERLNESAQRHIRLGPYFFTLL